MNNKKVKRVSAFLIMFLMFVNILPLNIIPVYANYQSNVERVTIAYVPDITSNNYKINFAWRNPNSWSTIQDVDAIDGDVYHTPLGFKVMQQNATANESDFSLAQIFNDPSILSTTIDANLNDGSIYAYKILPYHTHAYQSGTMVVNKEAPMDNNKPTETVLFMTDIQVEAEGTGSKLTVTWDNPVYKGVNVFNGYRIYYQRGGSGVTAFNNFKDVNIDDPTLIQTTDASRQGVQRLTYSIEDDTIVQGEVYAVKVEPLYNGAEIRKITNGLSYVNVTINNTGFKMAFRDMDTTEYRYDDITIDIPLDIMEDGKDSLKLHWYNISSTIGNIEKIEIFSGLAEDDIGIKIGTIYTPQALYVSTWQVQKPTLPTYYQIKVYIEGISEPLKSHIAYYDPTIVNITPNKPGIYPFVNSEDENKAIDLYWDVFVRYPYNDTEAGFVEPDGTYIDTNVTYKVWVSDNLENMNDTMMPTILTDVSPGELLKLNIEGVANPVYYSLITNYVTRESDGTYSIKEIEENKTYYIKIIATKTLADLTPLVSQPGYASIYVPIDDDIAKPHALSKPPLRIKKDSEGQPIITKESITVEWQDIWYEVFDEKTDSWYSRAALRDGELVFGYDIDEEKDTIITFHNASNENAVRELFMQAGLSEEEANKLIIRIMDISAENIHYEMKYLPFDEINKDGGYQAYLESIMNNEDAGWSEITGLVNENGYYEYTVENLEKNTTYVIILRPYRILKDGTKDAYPTYVIGTTFPDDVIVNIKPTVPILEEVDHTDVSFEVKWEEHIPNLDYEIVISETVLEDPSTGGTRITIDEIKENGEEKSENSKLYMYYVVNGVFPETGYYVWIRSIANNVDGPSYSQWSNPLYVVTDALKAPDPPNGLGLVSKDNLKIYNKANNTSFLQADYNYLIIEWFKNYYDENSTAIDPVNGQGYDILTNPEITETFIAKFNDLIANRTYYIRGKTTLIVTMNEEGKSQKSYCYTIQLANNEDFKDVVELTVPEMIEDDGSPYYFMKESEWTEVIRLFTEPNEDEYDGNKKPDYYPLPDDDFEILYDFASQSLTYRFRSNEEDDDGHDDNLVDQRFITRLIQNKIYNYAIDLTSYDGRDITNRIVEIPYSVMSAFTERKISMEVKANNATFTFQPEFLETSEVERLSDFGNMDSRVRLNIQEGVTSVMPALDYGQNFVSTPQKLNISINTPNGSVTLTNTKKPIDISLKLKNRYEQYDQNIGAFMDTENTDKWQRLESTYDYATGSYNTSTTYIGAYSAIAAKAPVSKSNSPDPAATAAVASITSKMYIEDLKTYNEDSNISALQFNNIVAAVANGKKSTTVNTALSDDDYNALSRKGILITGGNVTREEGINALVKLYEAKTKRNIAYYTPLSQTEYSDISMAEKDYQKNMLKAADIGFFEGSSTRPKEKMTMGEFLNMIDIIMQDSGM